MDSASAIERFLKADAMLQARILVRVANMLTIEARVTYEFGTDGVSNPPALRRINEVMHRVTSQVRALLDGDEERFPDEAIIRMISGLQEKTDRSLLSLAVAAAETKNKQ